jgi:hypothetical protein
VDYESRNQWITNQEISGLWIKKSVDGESRNQWIMNQEISGL